MGTVNVNIDSIVLSDAIEFMRGLPDQSVDMVLCDPPYGTTACAWDSIIPLDLMWREIRRVLKPLRAAVFTAYQPFTSALIMSNIEWFKYPMIWRKSRSTNFVNAKIAPLRAHEDICVFSDGTIANGSERQMAYYPQFKKGTPYKKKTVSVNVGNRGADSQTHAASRVNIEYLGNVAINEGYRYPDTVLEIAAGNHNLVHPTQKPVPLFEYLIKTYTQESELVLDFCMGSGTTAIASHNTGRHFIGCDISPEYVALANKRLADTDPFQPSEVAPGVVQRSLFSQSL